MHIFIVHCVLILKFNIFYEASDKKINNLNQYMHKLQGTIIGRYLMLHFLFCSRNVSLQLKQSDPKHVKYTKNHKVERSMTHPVPVIIVRGMRF